MWSPCGKTMLVDLSLKVPQSIYLSIHLSNPQICPLFSVCVCVYEFMGQRDRDRQPKSLKSSVPKMWVLLFGPSLVNILLVPQAQSLVLPVTWGEESTCTHTHACAGLQNRNGCLRERWGDLMIHKHDGHQAQKGEVPPAPSAPLWHQSATFHVCLALTTESRSLSSLHTWT